MAEGQAVQKRSTKTHEETLASSTRAHTYWESAHPERAADHSAPKAACKRHGVDTLSAGRTVRLAPWSSLIAFLGEGERMKPEKGTAKREESPHSQSSSPQRTAG